jgi:PAS domain-containing protein
MAAIFDQDRAESARKREGHSGNCSHPQYHRAQGAEKHLLQVEARYSGVLEAVPDAMAVVNRDGEIVLLNVQAEKQFGHIRDELVGQPVKNTVLDGLRFSRRKSAGERRQWTQLGEYVCATETFTDRPFLNPVA